MTVPKLRTLIVAALTGLLGAPAIAEPVLWKTVKSDFSEFRILADPAIARDPKLAFILQDELAYAEQTVREWDAFARQSLKVTSAEKRGPESTRQDAQTTLHLLAVTDRHMTIMKADVECNGSNACYSGEHVALFHLPARKKFERAAALQLDGQIELLNRLAKRDENRMIGRGMAGCDASDAASDDAIDAPCRRLAPLLGFENKDDGTPPFASAKDVDDFAKRTIVGVGFGTAPDGRVATLDIYLDDADVLKAHRRAFRWSIDARLAAPLLKPALRELINPTSQK